MAKILKSKLNKRAIRHKRVRSKIVGTAEKPRLSVFRSNKHIFMQLIDDTKEKTLVSASDLDLKPKSKDKKSKTQTKNKKTDIASQVGQLLAKKALDKNIKTVVFDRGGFKYHGRIKESAEGAREEGLKF